MHPLVYIAVSAARSAGNIILRNLDRVDQLKVDAKGRKDFVSDVDRTAEQEIIRIIHKAYPQHAILGEEGGRIGKNDIEWIIDPLDGTTNFLHRFPQFCTSIGIVERGELQHGVIYDPIKEELFTASRGQGAQLNNRRIRVSTRKSMEAALVATGEPLNSGETLDRFLPQLRRVIEGGAGIRRAGSAALDLAYVAAGRLDGYWELGLNPWDIAAGIVLVREAGGSAYGLNDTNPLESGDVVAANTKLIEPFKDLIGQ